VNLAACEAVGRARQENAVAAPFFKQAQAAADLSRVLAREFRQFKSQ
jgi:hypothetical protein